MWLPSACATSTGACAVSMVKPLAPLSVNEPARFVIVVGSSEEPLGTVNGMSM